MNMLKHLIVRRKHEIFNAIVSEFLMEETTLFNRLDFIRAYQNQTNSQVFPNQIRIGKFFDSWTLQKGYPIVKVSRDGNQLNFRQIIVPWYKNPRPFMIPISIVLEPNAVRDRDKTHPDLWLTTSRSDEIVYDVRGLVKWYVVNNQRAGYYRVLYDEWNYKLLRMELYRGSMRKIAIATRGQIVDDALFAAKLTLLPYNVALEMVQYLRNETEEIPWKVASFELQMIEECLRFTRAYKWFRYFMGELSRRFYRYRVEQAPLKSIEAIKWACFGESDECRQLTHQMFMAFLMNRESYENMNRITCEGVKLVDVDTFRYIKLSLFNEYRGMEIELYLTALICMENYEFLIETLNVLLRRTSAVAAYLTAEEKGRHLLHMVERSAVGAEAFLDFLFNKPYLMRVNLGERELVKVLVALSKSLYNRSHMRKLRLVLRLLKMERHLRTVFNNILVKRFWLERNLVGVTKILTDFWEGTDDFVLF